MAYYKAYKRDLDYSYCLGAYPSLELIRVRPDLVRLVFISSKFNKKDELIPLLEEKKIPYEIADKAINRIDKRGKSYLITVFDKFSKPIKGGRHLVLDHPQDMGNLGDIIRSMAAFSYLDLALIGKSLDIFDPRVIRASMGSIFQIRFSFYDNISEYRKEFQNPLLAFILDERARKLDEIEMEGDFSLVFGNEGRGLGEEYMGISKTCFIPQTDLVDSLNICVASSIAMYHFRKENR